VVLEAPNDDGARVRLADIIRHLEEGCTNRRPPGSTETCQKRACSAHTLRPVDPVASPSRPRVIELGSLGLERGPVVVLFMIILLNEL
jgi:hypothetical protein